MLNHRLIDPPRQPEKFVEAAVNFLQKHAKDKKVFCALSGGIDSAATYLLLKKANINTIPVFIDHGLMRIIRGEEEREHIKKMFPDVVVLDIRNEFLPKIFGEGDAEGKRKLFKAAYTSTISKVIGEESCDLLADGTILPDIEESFGCNITELKETMSLEEEAALLEKNKEGFVKSQHNLDIEYDVEATIQPVASLIKSEVRKVLEYLGMPEELVYRKAFPGPALAARIIGPVTEENLVFEKKVHDIVESMINDYYKQVHGKSMIINKFGAQEPFQAFAAIGEDIENTKVTGLVNGKRTYLLPQIAPLDWNYDRMIKAAQNLEGYSRLLVRLNSNPKGKYDVIIRSINSKDARTATVTNLPFVFIQMIIEELKQIPEIKELYFDFTPKPPATIEYV